MLLTGTIAFSALGAAGCGDSGSKPFPVYTDDKEDVYKRQCMR